MSETKSEQAACKSCPCHEGTPSTCVCDCFGCKFHCAACWCQGCQPKCKCDDGTNAPWGYMGPWHANDCWLYAVPLNPPDESEVCICPPGSYRLDCPVHWEIVGDALMREVTTTRTAISRSEAATDGE